MIFESFGTFGIVSENCHFGPHVDTKTPKFENKNSTFWLNRCMNPELQILTNLLKIFISTFLLISLRVGSAVFLKNTFALNVETCPSGPPDDTAEESAAHHFLAKHT